MSHVIARASYVEITFTDKHAGLLLGQLYTKVLGAMLDEKSPLYDNALASLLQGSTKPKNKKKDAKIDKDSRGEKDAESKDEGGRRRQTGFEEDRMLLKTCHLS